MPKRRRVLKKGERRELERMNRSVGSLHNFLGGKSEEAAEAICSELLKEGKIKNFWHIPSDSVLDHQGIDIVCETERGFFLINVKKSSFGVTKFVQQRETLKGKNNIDLHIIYPWRVIPESGRQEEARRDLEKILNGESPSYGILPDDIKKELVNPRFSRKLQKKQKNIRTHASSSKKPAPTAKERLEALKKKLGRVIKNKKAEYFWEVTISAMVNNESVEVKGRGEKREAAEIDAYEKLSKYLN